MATAWTRPATLAELAERGRGIRAQTPRRELAALSDGARDPLGILAAQDATRIPDLRALRAERMSASPFAFYRGTAALMAADLAEAPHSGILVASCGDAHVSNFGFYASAERKLMFDLNDFDEAAWAPWEWDVKRLVTSVIIGGRATERTDEVIDGAARAAVAGYVAGIRRGAGMSPTERYFTHFDVDSTHGLLDAQSQRALRSAVKNAQRRTGERAARRLSDPDAEGRRRFRLQPPTTVAVEQEVVDVVHDLVAAYRRSVNADIAMLLDHFTLSDVARRVVGVGSVGTRCYLALFQDGEDHTLLLQPKQASRSVLVEYGRMPQPPLLHELIAQHGEGARVVSMQRILQALSDPFLGHFRGRDGDYYVRQFHDMKGGIEVEDLDDGPFTAYARACGAILARAHSQSETAPVVAGYVGRGSTVADALVQWGHAYADLSLADHTAFRAAHAA